MKKEVDFRYFELLYFKFNIAISPFHVPPFSTFAWVEEKQKEDEERKNGIKGWGGRSVLKRRGTAAGRGSRQLHDLTRDQ